MDKGGTQTTGPKDKGNDDLAPGLTLQRWHRLRVSRKDGGRVNASIEDCVDESMQWLDDYI